MMGFVQHIGREKRLLLDMENIWTLHYKPIPYNTIDRQLHVQLNNHENNKKSRRKNFSQVFETTFFPLKATKSQRRLLEPRVFKRVDKIHKKS